MKKKILIVDDDFNFRSLIAHILKDEDYSVCTAEDGIVALRMLKSEQFSLLITDINMPNMDGIELFNNVKKLYPQITVIFISGFDYNNLDAKLLREETSYFFKKPFDLNLFKCTIKRILEIKYSESTINTL